MRGVIIIFFTAFGMYCPINAEAQSCGQEDCRVCLTFAIGKCIQYGNSPECEAYKKACELSQQEHIIRPLPGVPNGGPGGGSPRMGHPSTGPIRGYVPESSPALTDGNPALAPRGDPGAIPPELVPARVFLRAADVPPPSIGAYGIVALRSKPTSANRERLLRTCAAFVAHLPRQEVLPASIPLSDQMLTIWPLDDPNATGAKNDDCNFIIDHYDLFGGISAIQDAQRQGATLGGVGPFLIGWSPSNARGVPDKVVLVLDLSSFESQDSFDQAFLFWQKKIVEDPTLWRWGFSMAGLRLAIRDFVDHYGADVIKIWGTGR